MFFRQTPKTSIDKVRIFLQLSEDFDNKENSQILYSKMLTKEKALIEANILFNKLKEIQSQHAITIVELSFPSVEACFLNAEIIHLIEESKKHPEANLDNYHITIKAKSQELNELLHAYIAIDMSKIKNLDKLVFDSKYVPEEREDSRGYRKS
jgi:hypothetical protein